MIALQAKGTDPELGAKVDLAVGVEDRVAGTAHRVVGKSSGRSACGRELFEGRVQGSEGSDAPRGLETCRWPAVKGETDAHHLLRRRYIPGTFLHACFVVGNVKRCEQVKEQGVCVWQMRSRCRHEALYCTYSTTTSSNAKRNALERRHLWQTSSEGQTGHCCVRWFYMRPSTVYTVHMFSKRPMISVPNTIKMPPFFKN